MAINGSLDEASLADVLQLLALSRKSGRLSVSDQSNLGHIFLEDGRITHAFLVNRRHRLGDILFRSGHITQDQLTEAIRLQEENPEKKVGEILLETKAISETALRHYMQVQIEEAIYFLFTWRRGDFAFERDVKPDPHDFLVSINPESLLLEGARRVDEWSVIEKKIPSFEMVFRVDRDRIKQSKVDLSEEQQRIAELLDGERTVASIVAETGMIQFEVGKALYGLITAGFAEPVAPEKAQDPDEYSLEEETGHLNHEKLLAFLAHQAEFADPKVRRQSGLHIADCPTCSKRLQEIHIRRSQGLPAIPEGSAPVAEQPEPQSPAPDRRSGSDRRRADAASHFDSSSDRRVHGAGDRRSSTRHAAVEGRPLIERRRGGDRRQGERRKGERRRSAPVDRSDKHAVERRRGVERRMRDRRVVPRRATDVKLGGRAGSRRTVAYGVSGGSSSTSATTVDEGSSRAVPGVGRSTGSARKVSEIVTTQAPSHAESQGNRGTDASQASGKTDVRSEPRQSEQKQTETSHPASASPDAGNRPARPSVRRMRESPLRGLPLLADGTQWMFVERDDEEGDAERKEASPPTRTTEVDITAPVQNAAANDVDEVTPTRSESSADVDSKPPEADATAADVEAAAIEVESTAVEPEPATIDQDAEPPASAEETPESDAETREVASTTKRQRASKWRSRSKTQDREAEKARRELENSKSEAQKAKSEADKARDEADRAKADAEKARAEAERATKKAEKATSKAERAATKAEQERSEAAKRKSEAVHTKAETQKAKKQVEQARLEAEQAKLEAEQARQEAEEAETKADAAKSEAEEARSEAEKARLEADQAREEAERLKREVEAAKAEAAKAEAEKAEARAAEAVRAASIAGEPRSGRGTPVKLRQLAGDGAQETETVATEPDRWRHQDEKPKSESKRQKVALLWLTVAAVAVLATAIGWLARPLFEGLSEVQSAAGGGEGGADAGQQVAQDVPAVISDSMRRDSAMGERTPASSETSTPASVPTSPPASTTTQEPADVTQAVGDTGLREDAAPVESPPMATPERPEVTEPAAEPETETATPVEPATEQPTETVAAEAAEAATNASITGTVRSSDGGSLLASAAVSLEGSGLVTTTGTAGRFAFTGVPPGSLSVAVELEGYRPAKETIFAEAGDSIELDFLLNEPPAADEPDAELEEGNWTVTDLDGAAAFLGRPVAVISDLWIESVAIPATGTRPRVRIAHLVDSGERISLVVSRSGPANRAAVPRVTALRIIPATEAYPITTGTASFGAFLVTAKTRLPAETLRTLLQELELASGG